MCPLKKASYVCKCRIRWIGRKILSPFEIGEDLIKNPESVAKSRTSGADLFYLLLRFEIV
jgi:hypothetical protein